MSQGTRLDGYKLTFAIVSIPPRFVMALSSLSTIPAKGVCGGDRVYTCGKPSASLIPRLCMQYTKKHKQLQALWMVFMVHNLAHNYIWRAKGGMCT